MNSSFSYISGNKPLLISMPHNSAEIPTDLENKLTSKARMSSDTDWYIDKLYNFTADLGIHLLKPAWSRYYIDLNRDPDGKDLYPGSNSTELCPTTDFSGNSIYQNGITPKTSEINQRFEQVWKPYHQCIADTLTTIVQKHGYAILFDAHSIASRVPRFFDGSLPDFNFGSNDSNSCDDSLLASLVKLPFEDWSIVSNGRFKGGYITRHYGAPERNIHAIQLELSQATYMDEEAKNWDQVKAVRLRQQLKLIIETLLHWKPRLYR